MATTTTTSGVYIHVIEDVVSKVREEFINNGGPGESVLSELQGVSFFRLGFCLILEKDGALMIVSGIEARGFFF